MTLHDRRQDGGEDDKKSVVRYDRQHLHVPPSGDGAVIGGMNNNGSPPSDHYTPRQLNFGGRGDEEENKEQDEEEETRRGRDEDENNNNVLTAILDDENCDCNFKNQCSKWWILFMVVAVYLAYFITMAFVTAKTKEKILDMIDFANHPSKNSTSSP